MEKAALNTLMGMGTVFLVLIFISLIISSFKKVNEIEANVKAKKAGAEAPAAAPAPVQTAAPAAAPARTAAPAAGNAANDGELVAVYHCSDRSSNRRTGRQRKYPLHYT